MNSSLKILAGILLFSFACHPALTQAQTKQMLWPEGELPNSKGLAIEDSIQNDRFYQLKYPHMYGFHPAKEENSGAAVVIFPGGGYHHVTYDYSGFQLAKWFNTLGVHAFVVNYRLPLSPDLIQREIAPLQDAQRAMRLVRSQTAALGINPEKIGVLGTSAGGHLATSIATYTKDEAAIGDSLDQLSFIPDFMILISPVITFGEYAHEGSKLNLLGENPLEDLVNRFSNERWVTGETSPAFLVHAANDPSVHPMNSIQFYKALLEQGSTESSLHIFPQGGHNIDIVQNPGSTEYWKALCEEWLKETGFISSD
ncbi:alpha/beta hydrolase [Gracilimonas mengyeensis]|uniref:Acetyl esterase/lipase n=1 Tax=Gracilimonas mengyeensis TaxID=1302730 RepID=A0A521C4N1_9BACT|nr:alpha/beta hydrolase [Gracilimonas mengyeensis]SMO53670.1 Acetyl esterase/lipase [Gracilimonas mengyeensis]